MLFDVYKFPVLRCIKSYTYMDNVVVVLGVGSITCIDGGKTLGKECG